MQDVMDLKDTLGTFDYVIAHGIFSWVPPAVADEILALCARCLSPRGIAFISYNVLPGWYSRSVVRDLTRFHARNGDGLRARVKLAREAIAWLKDALPDGGRYAMPLVAELTNVGKDTDWTIAHEQLADHNTPFYFTDFVARAKAHGLAYLDDASPEITAEHGGAPDAARARAMAKNDPVVAEQYLDFLRGRAFRRTLLCRADVEVARAAPPDAVESLLVGSRVRSTIADPDVRRRASVRFVGELGETTTDHPLTKAALVHLAEVAPRAIPYPELLEAARVRLGDARASDRDVNLLRRFLVRTFLSTGPATIELRTFQPEMAATPSERPQTTRWARDEAKRHPRVTSARHEGIALPEPLRMLIPLLDGTRDQTEIAKAWEAASGRPLVPGALEAALTILAKSALLVS